MNALPKPPNPALEPTTPLRVAAAHRQSRYADMFRQQLRGAVGSTKVTKGGKMGRTRETVMMLLIGLLLAACQQAKEKSSTEAKGSSQIAGTYNCTDAPNDPDPETDPETGKPAVDVWEFRADGTLKQTYPRRVIKGETFEGWTAPPPGKGTWSAQGDSGIANPGRVPPPRILKELQEKGEIVSGGDDRFDIDGDRLLFGRGQYICTKTG